ncbi:MAG TPA: fibronectin type III domain-containing protein [bacterium]|nr:fibronectin type III domain-containing protein [bacterium]
MKSRIVLAAWVLLLSLLACNQLTEPVRNPGSNYPAAPGHLAARVGDRSVHLTWNPPAGEIERYFIFRADSLQAPSLLIDSCASPFYDDEGLLNGQRYLYRVAAGNRAGFRGAPGEPVSARPGLYSLLINDGALYTNSTTVTLRFIAPGGTRYVKVAPDTNMARANWQLYGEQISWAFPPGDGQKYIYALFLDSEGNQTGAPVADDIQLDTRAAIYTLEMSGAAAGRRTGEIVTFQMRTNEPYGSAAVDLGSILGEVRLHDDGTHGDVKANDGLYTHAYTIPPCEDIFNLSLAGTFTDLAGNVSDPFVSPQTLTIQNPPRPVQLFKPDRISGRTDALNLTWTVNAEADFSLYKLFRADKPQVDSTSLMVAAFSMATANNFVDSLLAYNHEYYYRLYVIDKQGLMSGSNIVSGRTSTDAAPQAAVLQSPLNVTTTSLILSWSQNNETDFAHYRLFRGSTGEVGSGDLQIALIATRSTTQYQESGLEPNTTYWYRLYTVDQSGGMSASNPVSVTTYPDEKPDAVLLAAPAASAAGAMRLTWSASRASGFLSYRIYRANTASVDNSGIPIVIINNAATTMHDDVGLAANTTYYYKIYVYDMMQRSTGSNTVYGTTLP